MPEFEYTSFFESVQVHIFLDERGKVRYKYLINICNHEIPLIITRFFLDSKPKH